MGKELEAASKDFSERVQAAFGLGFGKKKMKLIELAFKAGAEWQRRCLKKRPARSAGEREGR